MNQSKASKAATRAKNSLAGGLTEYEYAETYNQYTYSQSTNWPTTNTVSMSNQGLYCAYCVVKGRYIAAVTQVDGTLCCREHASELLTIIVEEP